MAYAIVQPTFVLYYGRNMHALYLGYNIFPVNLKLISCVRECYIDI